MYGSDWHPTPEQFVAGLELALDESLLELITDNPGTSEEESSEEEPEAAPSSVKAKAQARAAKAKGQGSSPKRSPALDADTGPLPTEWSIVQGDIPDASPLHWHLVTDSDGGAAGPLKNLKCDVGVIVDGLGLVARGKKNFLIRTRDTTDVDTEGDLDARVLPLTIDTVEGRHLGFRDAVKQLTETSWERWPILGPRTTRWVCQFIRDQDVAPRSRHAKWKAETQLSVTDQAVSEHEFCMRLLQVAVQYDQLNVSELAVFELICRKAQMAEYRHKEKVLSRIGGADDLLEDEHLYMGTSETRGMLMVSPLLVHHVSEELHREAAVLKERRKLREERATARGASGRAGDGGGGGGKGGAAALQSRVDKQQDEIKKLREQLAAPAGGAPQGGGARKGGACPPE